MSDIALSAYPSEDASAPRLGALAAAALALSLDGVTILDEIDLSLPPTGCTMILGPNGAGKSLLLKVLHGLLPPSAGTATWGDLNAMDATRHQSLVFQKPVLLRRSVSANVEFVLRVRKRPLTEAGDLLNRVGLSHKAAQPARRLSGGEAQRLQLARALATAPQVLLLDEPTASLDPASVLAFERIVADIVADGVKVVFVTHDLGQARRLADDVVFLHRGRVAEHAPANAFFPRPSTDAAREFINGNIVL